MLIILLHLPESADIKDVKADCFSVYAKRRDEEGKIIYTCPVWYKKEIKKSSGYRKILADWKKFDVRKRKGGRMGVPVMYNFRSSLVTILQIRKIRAR